jgi:hypothetical protein
MLHQGATNSQRIDAIAPPRRITRAVVLAIALLALVLAGVAYAGPSSSLKITGSTSFKLGTTIQLKGSGYTGKAGSVVVYLDAKGKCAKTAKAQKGKGLTFGPFSKNKSFTFPLPPLTPGNPPTSLGKHNICAFLTGPNAKKTYAHAAFSYTVHN